MNKNIFTSLFLVLFLSASISQASLPGSLGTAQASLEEIQRVEDLLNSGLNIEIQSYTSKNMPVKTPLAQFYGSLKDSTDIVKRLSMYHEDLLAIFPRHKVFGYVPNLILCIDTGCGSAMTRIKTMAQGATPTYFHRKKNDPPYFLDYREERLVDIHEFAHFMEANENMKGFYDISWDKNNRKKKLASMKKTDFLTTTPWYANASEDFGECVGWYVMRRDEFLKLAQKSVSLQNKYEWIKYNIFGGQEFTDALLGVLFKVPVPSPVTPVVTPPPAPQPPTPIVNLDMRRVNDLLISGIKINVRELVTTGTGKSAKSSQVLKTLQNYLDATANPTDVVNRLNMFYDDVFAIYPRDLVLRHVKQVDVCLNRAATTSSWLAGTIFLTATPKYFATLSPDTSFFLSNRQERLLDIREFALFLAGYQYVPVDSFGAISWLGTSRLRNAKKSDFVSLAAYGTSYQRDFAETVGWYVFRREQFLKAAKLSSALMKKYEWVRQIVFGGKEFTEDFLKTLFLSNS
ncbi:MAG: hypothetical protein HYW85_06825 [Deltaproteobacteria bacterium]|nr:hypothetical protein [Deltaproteobacteria bacterium]MBI3018235.1 hypothetical protein [Deltaproteobacteria bacterium]